MGTEFKPIGQGVAIVKGHYPNADGRHLTILPGQTFTVFEGMSKGRWFTMVEPGKSPAVAAAAPADPGLDTLSAAAGVERKRKAAAKPPTADDIA